MVVFTKTLLSGVALSGLLLAGSMPIATAAPQPFHESVMHLQTARISTGTYTKVVHKDLKWLPLDVQVQVALAEVKKETAVAVVAPAPSQSKPKDKQPQAVNKTTVPQRPVQVAVLPSEPASRGSSASDVVGRALSLQGVPYVFGGSSRNGFDCSGFTQYVFQGNGVSLPRTSYAQFGVGSSISKNQLQPGDLVFFTTYSKGASHVGIYVGGGRFVHASDSGVKTTSLSDSYYANRFLGARRVR